MSEERGKDGEEKGFKKKENAGSAWRRRSSQGRVAADLCLFVVLNVCADLFQALILQWKFSPLLGTECRMFTMCQVIMSYKVNMDYPI